MLKEKEQTFSFLNDQPYSCFFFTAAKILPSLRHKWVSILLDFKSVHIKTVVKMKKDSSTISRFFAINLLY